MFDLSQISNKSKTKFGLAVTILVFTAACAHESIPAQNANIYEPAREPSVATASPLTETKAVKKSRVHHHKIAKHKVHKHHSAVAKVKGKKPHKIQTAAATVTSGKSLQPRLPFSLASVSEEKPAQSIWDRIKNIGAWALIVLGLSGLVMVSRNSLRPKTKRKNRRLVYN